MICIDFQKAFDSVEWEFLHQVLEKFNFGPSFTAWVKTLYTDITSCITNERANGPAAHPVY